MLATNALLWLTEVPVSILIQKFVCCSNFYPQTLNLIS